MVSRITLKHVNQDKLKGLLGEQGDFILHDNAVLTTSLPLPSSFLYVYKINIFL